MKFLHPRSMPAALAALALLAGCAGMPRPVTGVTVPAPLPAGDTVDTYWNVRVPDPYRRLEDPKNPEVQRWMRAQNEATEAVLARLPGRAQMLARIQEIEGAAGGITTEVVRTEGGRLFFLRRNPGENQFKLVWRDGPDGADHVVFDPEAKRSGDQPQAVMDFSPSRDGKRLAYAVQTGGGEIGVMHVIDVDSGRALAPPIDRIRYATATWLDDGSGLFYGRLREGYDKLPEGERFGDRTAHFLDLAGGGSDRPVLSASRRPELGLPSYATPVIVQVPHTRLVAALVYMGVDRNLRLFLAELDAVRRGQASWRPVVASSDEVTSIVESGGWFYLKTAKNAPRFKVLRMPVEGADIARAQTVVPETEHAIGQIGAARDGLYFTRREGVNSALYRLKPDGTSKPQRVPLPVEGLVELKSVEAGLDGAVIGLVAWTRAFKDYLVPREGPITKLPLARDGAYDAPQDIESREVMVRSHDGTLVPLSIVARKGTVLDGSHPAILYGYGAYGSTDDPFFSPRVYAWIQRGGIFATVHTRGGGVFGRDWHEAGKKTTKPNTWKDAIAAAEWLVREGWTRPARLAVYGGSAGGILVGRAITERPDLFAAAVPAVGVMDAVRAEFTANGVANIPEFGSVKVEQEFKALLAMSSYHQVKDGTAYPAVLLVHGVNDIRVPVWNSLKFASRIATASTSGKPVLLRLEYDSGHGQGSTRTQAQERTTDIWSFLLWQFGDPAFQPRP